MPCQSYETNYYVDDTNKRVADKLARLLCGSLMWLEKHDKNAYTQLLEWPELADWWTEHQKADAEEAARKAKLIAEKKAKKAALKKLTPEERKLLGVGK